MIKDVYNRDIIVVVKIYNKRSRERIRKGVMG